MTLASETLRTPEQLVGSHVFRSDGDASLRINFFFREIERVTDDRGEVIEHGDFGVFEDGSRTGVDVFEMICSHKEDFQI